ncbi:transcriptional regulator, XRE family [Cyclonatronum proteinivorum]|uniref:Transcriptional regulator, XRE family n=2 Tax=Cyclonatronum proteinivorum TaxID=1457365 RepID=A0A345UGI7_9BACT|nr:transcriptional regulator, XRE family [Cyclonatronum proteinivorum]
MSLLYGFFQSASEMMFCANNLFSLVHKSDLLYSDKTMHDDLERFIEKKKAESPDFARNFEEDYLNFKIGVILRQAREEMGITQQEVAEKLNTSKSVISRMENHADDIRLSTLRKYAKALGRKVKLEIQ